MYISLFTFRKVIGSASIQYTYIDVVWYIGTHQEKHMYWDVTFWYPALPQ
jgi:hypothetical protein